MIILVTEALLLALALSGDAFISSFSYGAGKIKIPLTSALVVTAVSSLLLAVSMYGGALLRLVVPPSVTMAVCFVLLFALGLSRLFDSTVKAFIRRHGGFEKKIRFSLFNLGFILSVFASPAAADIDGSKTLSPREAVTLAVALSLDSITVGLGAGMAGTPPPLVVALSFIVCFAAIKLGAYLGGRFAAKTRFDCSWLSGAALLALAFLKLA